MVANQTECSRLEQRFVMKYLVTEKCKLYDIYKRIYDVYGEQCYSQTKMFTIGLKMGLLLQP